MALDRQKMKQRFERDFYTFAVMLFRAQFEDRFIWSENLHSYLCHFVSQPPHARTFTTEDGKVIQVPMVKQCTFPRGAFKSSLSAIAYPIWRFINDQNVRCLIAQMTFTNACGTIDAIRETLQYNDFLQEWWPELFGNIDTNHHFSSKHVKLAQNSAKEGNFDAAGAGTGITGRHYEVIIEDDLIAPTVHQATGEEILPMREDVEKAIGWHLGAYSLLDNYNDCEIVNIGTRWVLNDLIDYIVAHDHPVLMDVNVYDEAGEPTFPEKYSVEVLNGLRERLGPHRFSALYLNNPLESNLISFKPEMLQYYTEDHLPSELRTFTTVDPAITQHRWSDMSAIVTCSWAPQGRMFVREYEVGRWPLDVLCKKIAEQAFMYRPERIQVEGGGFQQVAGQQVQAHLQENGCFIPVTIVPPISTQSKSSNIEQLQTVINCGKLFLLDHMHAIKRDIKEYPFVKHDDLLDALSWQLRVGGSPSEATISKSVGPETWGDVMDNMADERRPAIPFYEKQVSEALYV